MPKKLKRKYYTEEFKHQIVQLYENGKKRADILAEYEISGTSLDNWVKRFKNSGSFQIKDNRSKKELELKELKRRNKELEMEVDILKQAALIIGRK